MNSDMVWGIVRHALTTAGGGLVAQGLISTEQLNTVVGAIVVVAGVLWSVYQKRKVKA